MSNPSGETIRRLTEERDALRQHILDIDAHATPYGDIPDEPGWVWILPDAAGRNITAGGPTGHPIRGEDGTIRGREGSRTTEDATQTLDPAEAGWAAHTGQAEAERWRAE